MKILFSDFDGTLVEEHHLKCKQDPSTIQSFQKDGNIFVVCTGRCLQEIERDLPKYKIPYDYLILNNGSQILDHDFNIIYEKTIDADAGKSILDYLLTFKDLWVYFSNHHVSYGKLNNKCIDQSTGKPVDIDYRNEYQSSDHFNILCCVQKDYGKEVILPIIAYLKQQYPNDIEVYLNTCFVDIVAKGCSKGNSIHLFKELLNMNVETYAIGDSYNDLPMIQQADFGYTFRNVDLSKEIKNQVDSVSELIQLIKEK